MKLHKAAIIKSFSICITNVRAVTKASKLILCKHIHNSPETNHIVCGHLKVIGNALIIEY